MEMSYALESQWEDITRLLSEALKKVGLNSFPSFDLHSARSSLLDPGCCPCPSHGSVDCSCQYIIYMVDDGKGQPLSIEIHGHDDQTFIRLIPALDGEPDDPSLHLAAQAIDQLGLQLKSLSA